MIARDMKILVPTAGFPPALQTAYYIVRIAHSLRADLVVLHVYSGNSPSPDARAAFDVFIEAGQKVGVGVHSRVQRGDVIDSITSIAGTGEYALIVMGASNDTEVDKWISARLLNSTRLPVVVIPHAFEKKGNQS